MYLNLVYPIFNIKWDIISMKGGITMGLGILALGLLLLEGLKIGLNGFELFPSYIALFIVALGILFIKRRVRIELLDRVLKILTFYFIYLFISFITNYCFNTFLLDSGLHDLGILFDFIFSMILFLVAFRYLFQGIYQLTNDVKLYRTSMHFWYLYLLLSFYWLIAIIPIFDVTILTILLFIKCFYICKISFAYYRWNQKLSEEYEIDFIEKGTSLSLLKRCFLFLICIFMLFYLKNPFLSEIKKSSQLEYHWYGEIEDEIIIDNFYYIERTSIFGQESDFLSPFIWINDEDFQRSNHIHISMIVGNDTYDLGDLYDLIKNIDESDNYFIGKRDGYQRIIKQDYITYIPTDDLYKNRYAISFIISLYDEDNVEFETYHVPMENQENIVDRYEYEDQELTISNMQIDGNFLISLPQITFQTNKTREYHACIIDSDDYNQSNVFFIQEYFDISDNNTYTLNAKKTHIYYPHRNYHICIGYYTGDVFHPVKTVRLVKT